MFDPLFVTARSKHGDENSPGRSGVIGRGLSRLLSYAYGGFLAAVILHFFDPGGTGDFFKKDRTWELLVLACIVVGAGIYRAHRSAVIPVHHWIGCFLFWVWDKLNGTPKEKSVSPTRWFNSLGVPRCRRILAYNVLRHDPEFMSSDEQERHNLLHAEFGLVVMAAEGCFVGAAYARLHSSSSFSPLWWIWLVMGFLLVAASYPAPLQQHATECLRWRVREKEEKNKEGIGAVSATLIKYGLLEVKPS